MPDKAKYSMTDTHTIRYWMTLCEGMVDRLYHGTTMRGLEEIFACDCLKGSDGRISLARQPQASFMDRPAILVLNAARIRQQHRLEPRYGDSRHFARVAAANPGEYQAITPRRETEESLSSDLSPLHRYLEMLVLGNDWWQSIKDAVRRKANTASGIDALAIFGYLRQHRIPVLGTDLTRAGWQATLDRKAQRWHD